MGKYFMHKSRREGLMLYEVVIALLVTVITLGILQQSLQIASKVQSNARSEALSWHISNEKIQDLFLQSKVLKIDDRQIVFEVNENKAYSLEAYKDETILRMTGADAGGHMPVLTNLTKIRFKRLQNIYIITTTDKSNRKSEMYLINEPDEQ